MALDPSGANAEQIRYWNEAAGPRWIALQGRIDAQIRPLGLLTLDRAALRPGDRVIDVGCGCGDSTLEIARRVGPSGDVLGIDISTGMLARAEETARAQGLRHIRFANADAQSHAFEPGAFDVLTSRFGVMFFVDPRTAFANLARALAPGGRVAFVSWQSLQRNPWVFLPLMAAATVIELPPRPAPDAPGPFAFADPARVRTILEGAGYADVELEEVERTLDVGGGGGLEDAADFLVQMGPTGQLLRDAAPETRARVAAAVREALAPFAGAGGVRMESASWVVTAKKRG